MECRKQGSQTNVPDDFTALKRPASWMQKNEEWTAEGTNTSPFALSKAWEKGACFQEIQDGHVLHICFS
jgi:hypothetical protein